LTQSRFASPSFLEGILARRERFVGPGLGGLKFRLEGDDPTSGGVAFLLDNLHGVVDGLQGPAVFRKLVVRAPKGVVPGGEGGESLGLCPLVPVSVLRVGEATFSLELALFGGGGLVGLGAEFDPECYALTQGIGDPLFAGCQSLCQIGHLLAKRV